MHLILNSKPNQPSIERVLKLDLLTPDSKECSLRMYSCMRLLRLPYLPSAASKKPFVSKRGGAISDVNVQLAVTLHPAGGGVTGGGGGAGLGFGGGGGAGSFGRIRCAAR